MDKHQLSIWIMNVIVWCIMAIVVAGTTKAVLWIFGI